MVLVKQYMYFLKDKTNDQKFMGVGIITLFGSCEVYEPCYEKISFTICKEQMCKSGSQSTQSDQLLNVAVFLRCFIIPPVYEVYRGYIVFAFSVRMFVCLSVCLSVNFFFVKDFSETT